MNSYDQRDSTTPSEAHLQAALAYAREGVPVFPCRANKAPLTEGGFKSATTDHGQIRAWWTAHPQALIGRPTGAASGVVVLDVDIDPNKGIDGEEALQELQAAHDRLPDTWEAQTPRGGRHLYFRHPGGEVPCSAGKLGRGLDIRGDGGYVIAPPSVLPNGHGYAWEGSSNPGEGAQLAPLPDWLAALLTAPTRPQGAPGPKPQETAIPQGERNARMFSLACSLRAKEFTENGILAAVREENAARCNPPLEDDEIVRLVASAAGKAPGHSPEFDAAQAPEPWPELIPLGDHCLPRLAADILPDWAGAYADALATATETPPELAIGLILTAAAVPCARRLRVQVAPGHLEPCNLWVAVALAVANRKSPVQAAVCRPLVDWEREQAAAVTPEIRRWESETRTLQARANAARAAAAHAKDRNEIDAASAEAADLEARIEEAPRLPQLWTSDATPERLGSLLADQGECMGWLSSEAGLFDLLAGRYSNGIPNLDLVLKAWSGDPERVDRGSRPPVYLLYPRLTIGLSPQPDALRGLATQPGFRGRGLLGRFGYLLPPSPLGYRNLSSSRAGASVPESVEAAYRAGLRAMLDWPGRLDDRGEETQPNLVHLSPAAYADWLDFARAVEVGMRPGGEYEGATDLAGKIPGTAARIAAVLHGIAHAHGRGGMPWEVPVQAATMAGALEIAAVMLNHGLAAMDLMGADPTIAAARKVWEWLERGRRDRATVREAHQALKGTFPRVAGLNEALEILYERGYLRVQKPVTTSPGRPPSPVIEVRPDIAEGWL